MVKYINVKTATRLEMVNITSEVQELVDKSKIKDGICYLYIPHTTAGLVINEGVDPGVKRDILYTLKKLVPSNASYAHMGKGNADAHIKSSLTGASIFVMIENGKLLLGTWQAIFFCEFDGPRHRRVAAKIVSH